VPGLAVSCRALRRTYPDRRTGEVVALDGIDLDVPAGSVHGMLGPNGAGKTTLVRILSTLLAPTSGTAAVLGIDVVADPRAVRRQIGLVLGGERGLFPRLTGRENLEYFAGLHGLSGAQAAGRITTTLDTVSLGGLADRRVEHYSRGMRQRLHLARGLLNEPRVLFLDEPTIGLDPESADELRGLIPQLADTGVTVLLTTHYMAEADQLCDRLVVVDHGAVIADGTPEQIKHRFARVAVVDIVTTAATTADTDHLAKLDGVRRVTLKRDDELVRITLQTDPGTDPTDEIARLFRTRTATHVTARAPTLEEAYLSLFWR
jgi:ABC-2 type transport system ATP-binding protein